MSLLVRAATLSNYAEVARQYGLDPTGLLRAAGLDPGCLQNPDLRIPAATVLALLETSAEQAGCPTFGLQMAESRRLSDFGSISLLVRHQPTLRAALCVVMRYRRELNDAVEVQVEEQGERALLREELRVRGAAPSPQAVDLAVGVMFRLMRTLLGRQWQPQAVCLQHAAPTSRTVYRRVFGLDVEFGAAFNGIVFAAADLDRPNPGADPVMARYAQQLVDAAPTAGAAALDAQVREALSQLLPVGRGSAEQVARSLGLNLRALQRQLQGSGQSFSLLLNQLRRELVLPYLDDGRYTLRQVSELLGFGAQSVFSRWFAAEFGRPPRQWRQRPR